MTSFHVGSVDLQLFVGRIACSPLAGWQCLAPWELTTKAGHFVRELLPSLDADYTIDDAIAVHRTAEIESAAVIKTPAVIGPGCFVAAGGYVRGGVWLEAHCVVGPGSEIKSSFLFRGSKLAHFNFVGDSVLGENVNLEAGSIVANRRNERDEKGIVVTLGQTRIDTGVEKFGALIGDGCCIGANAVIAPGAILARGTVIPRLGLVDQSVG